jgi:hypothetical protein
LSYHLKTVRAYQIKESFDVFWSYLSVPHEKPLGVHEKIRQNPTSARRTTDELSSRQKTIPLWDGSRIQLESRQRDAQSLWLQEFRALGMALGKPAVDVSERYVQQLGISLDLIGNEPEAICGNIVAGACG